MKRHLCAIALTALATTGSPASASTISSTTATHTVYLNGFTFANASEMTLQSAAPGISVAPFAVDGAQYSGTIDGKSFETYCAEITQYLYFRTSYNDYTIVDGVSAWGVTKSLAFDHLISSLFSQHSNGSSIGSGMTQAALWEVLYETSATLGFQTGSFEVTGSNNAAIASNAVDWASLNVTPITYHADLLRSPTAQDLFLITAVTAPGQVPEPSGPVLLIAGLGALALAGKLRRRSANDRGWVGNAA